ncbi:DUF1128 family protein [Paenibacillus sp. JTLBN-2024]
MDLSQKTAENIEYMIEQIKTKLRMASGAHELHRLFGGSIRRHPRCLRKLVMTKSNLSISEVEALVSELGRLRSK